MFFFGATPRQLVTRHGVFSMVGGRPCPCHTQGDVPVSQILYEGKRWTKSEQNTLVGLVPSPASVPKRKDPAILKSELTSGHSRPFGRTIPKSSCVTGRSAVSATWSGALYGGLGWPSPWGEGEGRRATRGWSRGGIRSGSADGGSPDAQPPARPAQVTRSTSCPPVREGGHTGQRSRASEVYVPSSLLRGGKRGLLSPTGVRVSSHPWEPSVWQWKEQQKRP